MIPLYLFIKSHALKGNEILFMLLRIDWIKKGILLVIKDFSRQIVSCLSDAFLIDQFLYF